MNLRHLATFLAIARVGSFSRAARELSYAQSTVTLHVQELEAELGATLFHRSRAGVFLTEAGKTLVAMAAPIVTQVEELRTALAELSSGAAGQVAIGAVEPAASVRLPPLLAQFYEARPGVELSVDVTTTRSIAEQVASGRLDVGLSSTPPPGIEVDFEPLFTESLTLLVPAAHPLASAPTVTKDDLARNRVMVTEEGCAYRRAIDAGMCAAGTTLGSVMEITSVATLSHSVQAGLGVALVPQSTVSPPPHGTVTKPIDDISFCIRVGLVTRSGGPRLSATVSAFVDHLRASLTEPAAVAS
jgi:LysR family transcriptional regulator, regulator of the ytmI operon